MAVTTLHAKCLGSVISTVRVLHHPNDGEEPPAVLAAARPTAFRGTINVGETWLDNTPQAEMPAPSGATDQSPKCRAGLAAHVPH